MQGLWTQSQETHHLCTALQDDDDVEITIREHLPGKETVIVHCALSQVRGPFCADRCVASSLQVSRSVGLWWHLYCSVSPFLGKWRPQHMRWKAEAATCIGLVAGSPAGLQRWSSLMRLRSRS